MRNRTISVCQPANVSRTLENRTNFAAILDMPRTLSTPIEMPYGFFFLHGGLPSAL